MGAVKVFRPDADTLPPPEGGDAYSAQTREVQLTESLVAKLMEAQAAAERRENERKRGSESVRTERRRKRSELTTLDRDNPFLAATPMAPWEAMPIPPRDDPDSAELISPERRAIDAAAETTTDPAAAAEAPPATSAPAKSPSGPALEVVLVVWAVLAALAAVGYQLVG
jgi:hypothetical protein